MFTWLQHLFTARALQRELSELTKENESLKLQIAECKKVNDVKDEEIRSLNNRLNRTRSESPKFADGIEQNPFGF